MSHPERAYLNGEIVPIHEANVSIMDRGFLFGDGVYEVAAVLNGRLVDGPAHLARLERSLREIELRCPIPAEDLPAVMQSFVTGERLSEGMIYIQVTRGRDISRAFHFPNPEHVDPTMVMFVVEKDLRNSPTAEIGIKAITVPEIRWARRDIKSISLLGQVLCKQAAVAAGAAEALMVEDGFITEGATAAACLVTADGRLVMRPVNRDILDSITRRATFLIAVEMDLPIEERRFTPAEAYVAKEVFCASASALIFGIIELDGHVIGDGTPGPITRRLREIYLNIASSEDPVFVKDFFDPGHEQADPQNLDV